MSPIGEYPGLFVVFDGPDGSGKTTQAQKLYQWLLANDMEAILTKEPGDALDGKIRKLLLDTDNTMSAHTELLLFEADRAEHVRSVVLPALSQGKIVICDRYEAGTFAYQCHARRACSVDEFVSVNDFATGGLHPDITFWIDIPLEIGLERNRKAEKHDRFEQEELAFHRRVHAGFDRYFVSMPKETTNYIRIDGSENIDTVHSQICYVANQLL